MIRIWISIELGAMMGAIVGIIEMIIVFILRNPVNFLLAMGGSFAILFLGWLLVEYVLADYIGPIIARLLIPGIIGSIHGALMDLPHRYHSIRSRRRRCFHR